MKKSGEERWGSGEQAGSRRRCAIQFKCILLVPAHHARSIKGTISFQRGVLKADVLYRCQRMQSGNPRTLVRKFLQFSHLEITSVKFQWNGSEFQFVYVCHGGKWRPNPFPVGLLQFYCQALNTKGSGWDLGLGLETSGCDISWTLWSIECVASLVSPLIRQIKSFICSSFVLDVRI